MTDSPFHRTQNGVFSIQKERIDRSSGECRVTKEVFGRDAPAALQPAKKKR
jgi:hypothetical protein